MSKSIDGSFTRAIQFTNMKFKDLLLRMWGSINSALLTAWQSSKNLITSFI